MTWLVRTAAAAAAAAGGGGGWEITGKGCNTHNYPKIKKQTIRNPHSETAHFCMNQCRFAVKSAPLQLVAAMSCNISRSARDIHLVFSDQFGRVAVLTKSQPPLQLNCT
jgi:hypothetical protein